MENVTISHGRKWARNCQTQEKSVQSKQRIGKRGYEFDKGLKFYADEQYIINLFGIFHPFIEVQREIILILVHGETGPFDNGFTYPFR